MKHLRRFNEGKVEDIREFCKMHLANLLDYGYDFILRDDIDEYTFLLFNNYEMIKWNEIKDEFIPFLQVLKNEYIIEILPYYKNNTVSCYRYRDDNPTNRTIRFKPDHNYYYYSNIKFIIDDKDVPSEFYQIQITFKQRS